MKWAVTCIFLFGVIAGLALAPAAKAWGCKGHQTVALIAEKHLTPEAKQLVQKLLSENPIDPKLNRYCGGATRDLMADASTWADDIRGERKNGPWHYIDIPRGSQRGPLEPYCGKEGCVTKAISEQLAILKDGKAEGVKRAEALRYIIHFVGDLHQPLHTITNADEGGNCVPVKYLRRKPRDHNHSFSPNLHSIWDTAIPERDAEGADPAEYAETLDAHFAADIEKWQKAGIHADDWVWEGFEIAESVVYGSLRPKIAIEPNVAMHSCSDDNNIGQRLLQQNIAADEAYQEQAAAVAEKRLEEGGVRLAMILNEAARVNP
ncbi:MAG TPA: S1/P1 nuclease [Candidatus Acidoferrum sp.]|nr:S1/P1 nuclease [Candidatus Acidoferrum sp.]